MLVTVLKVLLVVYLCPVAVSCDSVAVEDSMLQFMQRFDALEERGIFLNFILPAVHLSNVHFFVP